MRNFYQATPTLATSGQPTREEFAQIAADGYDTVINLAMHNSDDAIADEGSIVAGLGMSYIHLPVRFDAPTVAQVRTFIGMMQALREQKVWVHCVVNARVSAFTYLYRVHIEGVPPEQAKSPVLQAWESRMEPAWRDLLALDATQLGL